MSFDDYAGLKQEVIAYSGRDDLSDRFDSFLALTESAMYNNADRPLRVKEMESVAALVTVAGTNSVDLPADFLESRSLTIETGGRKIELPYESPSTVNNDVSGYPCSFTIVGTAIVFDRTPDGVYDLSLTYYAKPVALSTTDSTNAILTNYPDIYFYGCLSRVFIFSTETEEAMAHRQMFLESIRGAVKADERAIRKIPRAKVSGSTP